MHGYSGFHEDVKSAFSDLIYQKNPIISIRSNIDFGIYAVELTFEYSKLIFDLDRMDLQSNFVNPKDNKIYNVLRIAALLHRKVSFQKTNTITSETRENILEHLRYTNEIIEKYLMNVVEGDFTWTEIYLKHENEESRMIQEVLNLEPEDLISQKFWKGDETWKIDLKIRNENR
ncbi:MAG: hypothetical protein NVSMB24_16510 [Mucilaginibacter sp.]